MVWNSESKLFTSLRRKRSKKKGRRTERTSSSLLSFLETPACLKFFSMCTRVKQDLRCGTSFGRCSRATDGGSKGIADMRPNNREQADACPTLTIYIYYILFFFWRGCLFCKSIVQIISGTTLKCIKYICISNKH